MSSADVPGWMFPQHERGVAAQLTDGIRAFLIDVHYGRPRAEHRHGPRCRNRLPAEDRGSRGPRRVSRRPWNPGPIRGRGTRAERAVPLPRVLRTRRPALGPWLSTVADFLVQHPEEVVVLVIEDYVAPADIAAEFDRAGLSDLVYRGSGQGALAGVARSRRHAPARRRDDGIRPRRCAVAPAGLRRDAGERCTGSAIRPRWEPRRYPRRHPGQPCFRSTTGSTRRRPRSPSNAAIVNAHDALLARARRCQEERGIRPTILAVDFYRTGDVVGVARALNQ